MPSLYSHRPGFSLPLALALLCVASWAHAREAATPRAVPPGQEESGKTRMLELGSEKLFETLSEEERQYWHPHNFEILSGQLIAPGIPEVLEKSLMKSKMNSYGKTWHVWNSGHQSEPADELPLGPPMLAWSFDNGASTRSWGSSIAQRARCAAWSRRNDGNRPVRRRKPE